MGSAALVLDRPVTAPAEAPERDSDSDLVAAVRRGDDRAFEQLYSRYQRRISAYIFGMVKDHGRAEDITQEVFISALRRMRDTDRAIAFKPWIYEIAKNACIDQFRRSRRTEEVSFDAGEGLGGHDQGRLVAAEPTPDDAVDAKQQLEQLCGAFGGLSDSHHEILVLREFEGLSYREIGDRMGLSRPGVESTLFRARKRLTEEYDELVSGQRCVRIQSIIVAAESAALGARDTRRLARHISHCQPCRRQAVASGIDAAILARKPVRERIAAKVAGLLPLPAFIRARLWHGSEQMVPVSEPVAAAWSKAVAVAATLVVAGVGAGVAPQHGGADAGARRRRAGEARRGRLLRHHAGPEARPRRRRQQHAAVGPQDAAPRSAPAAATARRPSTAARRPRSRARPARRARAVEPAAARARAPRPPRPRSTPAARRPSPRRASRTPSAPSAGGRPRPRACRRSSLPKVNLPARATRSAPRSPARSTRRSTGPPDGDQTTRRSTRPPRRSIRPCRTSATPSAA